ncbi:hypothetical protein CBE79_04590 [Priestia megaterium]|nr:hypothetical protein CBE78_02085 [Priestia megaterium]TPF22145.1 hypothetical protein CBE79_04590 [Priestia megaterium]
MLFLIIYIAGLAVFLFTFTFLYGYKLHKDHIRDFKTDYGKAKYKDFVREFNKYEWSIDNSSICDVLKSNRDNCRVYDDIYKFRGKYMMMSNPIELLKCKLFFNREYKKLKKGINYNTVKW